MPRLRRRRRLSVKTRLKHHPPPPPPPPPRPQPIRLTREDLLLPEDPIAELFGPQEWRAIGRALELSQRELAVTILLAKGVSRQVIGHYLHKADGTCLSADTVRVYIDRVFRKAQVSDRWSLAMRLARAYLLLRGMSGADSGGAVAAPAVAARCRRTV